jgi:uncharacterized protein with GYD domain
MQTFVMLTRLAPGSVSSPKALEGVEREAMDAVRKNCPEVNWIGSYAVLGPCDYLDIFEAPDITSATRVSALIRTFGHAHTEVWGAMAWNSFKETVRGLS